MTPPQRGVVTSLQTLFWTQHPHLFADLEADNMLQEEVTELALFSLPDWFAVLLPVSSDGGSGGSAPGGSPAAGTEAAGVQEGLAAVVLRLHVGLAAFFSTYCDGPGPLHGKIFVTKKAGHCSCSQP